MLNIFKRQSPEIEESKPEPELGPMPIPQWIEDIITNVVIPPPPKVTFYCPMCGEKREVPETDEGYRRGRYFCALCEPKYDEYTKFVNTYNMHDVQYSALRSIVYRFHPRDGKDYGENRLNEKTEYKAEIVR